MGESSRFAGVPDGPYYPVHTAEDRSRLLRYRSLARCELGVLLGGRLGTYRYLDIRMAIARALTTVATKLCQSFLDRVALNGRENE